jgi:uncharacterized Rmd1/YagE family protein
MHPSLSLLIVLNDMLNMLNIQVDSAHGNWLEWVVIWLIVIEVIVDVGWNMIVKDIMHWV